MIINLGGGVITDMGGFIASTYKRGVDFVNIPTTLLSMVDASIGSKTGINLNSIKNQIGLFSDPSMVIIDTSYLKTLSKREINSGYSEIFKHSVISSHMYKELIENPGLIYNENIIANSIELKNKIVNEDKFEIGIRKYLNFGHTVGHLIEQDSKFTLSHGEAVAIGMIYELELSKKHFGLPQEVIDLYVSYLEKLDYKKSYEFVNDIDYLLGILKDDKKSKSDSVDIVLLSDISQPNLISISFDELIEVIQN